MFRFQGIRRLVNLRKANQQKELVYTVEDSGLSRQQIAAGNKAFKALDLLDRTNNLSVDDLTRFLYAIGLNPTPDVVGTKLRLMKLHQRQSFTWGELAHLWRSLEADKGHEEEILARAFQFFDKDGNGDISVAELRTTMHELGDLLTEEEIMEFVGITDANNDGVIAYHEFLEILKSQAPALSSADRPSQDDALTSSPGPSKRPTASMDSCRHILPNGHDPLLASVIQQQEQQQQHQHQHQLQQKEGQPQDKGDEQAYTASTSCRSMPHALLPGQLNSHSQQTRAPSALDTRMEGEPPTSAHEAAVASAVLDATPGPMDTSGAPAAAGVPVAGPAGALAGGSSSGRAFASVVDAPALSSPRGANRLRPMSPHLQHKPT